MNNRDDIRAFYANIKPLEQEDLFSHFLCRLSDERQQKIKALRVDTGRRQALGAWTLMDAMLAQFYGLRERAVQIRCGTHGKPYIAGGSDAAFNLSHSGDYVLAVFAPTEVGCDIQKVTDGRQNARIAARFFTPEEQAALAEGVPFARLWARKESWIKCSGDGLAQDLRSFSVAQLAAGTDGRYLAEHAIAGYEMAVCYQADERLNVWWQEIDWRTIS